jgi:hypothetical protein
MSTCETCKQWDMIFDHRHQEIKSGFGECSCEKFVVGYLHPKDINKLDTDNVMIEGDEGWGYITGKDFGCIHWEKKDDATHHPRT